MNRLATRLLTVVLVIGSVWAVPMAATAQDRSGCRSATHRMLKKT
jgi:hypothetical protein